MTDRLPRVTASEIIRILEKSGFSLARQAGSHKRSRGASCKEADLTVQGLEELRK